MHLCDATGRLLAAAGHSTAPALGAHRADTFRPVSSDIGDDHRVCAGVGARADVLRQEEAKTGARRRD